MTSRRRVLFLLPALAGGGAERVILTLARHLDRSRFEPAIAVLNTHGEVLRHEVASDVELIELGCSRVRYALGKITRMIRQRRPDIVFSTLGHVNLAVAAVRRLLPANTRLIARETTIVTEGLLDESPFPALHGWAYRRLYPHLHRVVFQSEAMRNDMVDNFGFPVEKAVVIHNPCDVTRVKNLAAGELRGGRPAVARTEGGLHLVAAGRLVPSKGFDLLLDAVAQAGLPDLRLTILGEGPSRPRLTEQAKELGIAERLQMPGYERNPYPYYAAADAFILSSRFEGFPNVVLEALACGTPVISTPAVGGVREILAIRPECVLAREVTAPSLARAIRAWADGSRSRVPSSAMAPYEVRSIVAKYEALLGS